MSFNSALFHRVRRSLCLSAEDLLEVEQQIFEVPGDDILTIIKGITAHNRKAGYEDLISVKYLSPPTELFNSARVLIILRKNKDLGKHILFRAMQPTAEPINLEAEAKTEASEETNV